MRFLLTLFIFVNLSAPVNAERLALKFLPPDFPPSNVCNSTPEIVEDNEIQETESGEGEVELENEAYLAFLRRDIRNLSRDGAESWFTYINHLISLRAELESGFQGFEEAFARIELHLAANRLSQLKESGLLNALRLRIEEMTGGQKVELARYFLSGIGTEPDLAFAHRTFVEQALLGNTAALFELLKIQMAGGEIEGWLPDIEATAKLAFGGRIGKFNAGLCARAESVAREYIDGQYLQPNPELAYAWHKFAADMGGIDAAWRVVEHHLNATAPVKDDVVLAKYLRQAAEGAFSLLPEDIESLHAKGATLESHVRSILGHNRSQAGDSRRTSAAKYLQLNVALATSEIGRESEYLAYLQDVVQLPNPPAPILKALGQEILLRSGLWAGEAEALPYITAAVAKGDADAMLLLAKMKLRKIDEDTETEQLLLDAVQIHGHPSASKRLEGYYRCQATSAPMLSEANFWLSRIKADSQQLDSISPEDLAKLDLANSPELIAQIQSNAISGHSISQANFLQILQTDSFAKSTALAYWARRVSSSDVALETFVRQEFALAQTPIQADNALELFRRAYLEIGPAIALDLAVAQIDRSSRSPEIADEIRRLLTGAANRGEGAAIRLLHRLGSNGETLYETYKTQIEERGDFLGLIFALPFVDDATFDRYMKRAVSIMNCRSNDIGLIADAHARRGNDSEALRWLRIGQTVDGGHVLTRLGLKRDQVANFNIGDATPPVGGNYSKQLIADFLSVSDPNAPMFNPDAAASYLVAIVESDPQMATWAFSHYRNSSGALRLAYDRLFDVPAMLRFAADNGDTQAQYELSFILRQKARSSSDLQLSTEEFADAALAGHPGAMREFGYALGLGIGVEPDLKLAIIWLEKAKLLHDPKADEILRLFQAMDSQ